MKGEKIKAVIFDVGGVLELGGRTRFNRKETHTSGVHENLATKLGLSVDQYFDSIDSYYAKSMEGQIDKKTLLKVLSLNLNHSAKEIEDFFHKEYRKKFKKNKELYSVAKKIKKQGYKIAILSDQWHLSSDVFITKKEYSLFDEVVVSCNVGIRKPNKEIYELILKKLKIKPEEAIFIDNQPWNIIPASKMGIKTILHKDNKKTKEELKKFGIKL